MSAQAGVWNFDGAPASPELLANISQTICQYGPDGERTYFNDPIGMLYRPFHTTNESRVEHQPHISSRGTVIMWDGRLDNREELVLLLGNDLSPEQTDLVIVTAAFERWETDCFCKLAGDWALSIWDPIQRALILARDYIGVRHLYYYPTSKRVIWCTYLAPLVLSGDRFTLDEEYVAGYLALYPEAHLTPYREIHAVPPGNFVSIREGQVTVHSHWAFNPKAEIHYKTDEEYEEHFRQTFRQAVRRRLRSDSPILAELSGGLDSSSIVCMADDILAKEGAEAPRVDTLSFYDPTEPDGDERPYFSKVEEQRGRKGHHCDAGGERILIPTRLPHFVSRPGDLGERIRPAENFRRRLFERHGYRVTLSGIGGDEFLGGVPDPTFQLADLVQQVRVVELGKQLIAWSLAKRKPWIQLLGQACVQLLPLWARARFAQEANLEPWIDGRFALRHRLAVRRLGPESKYGFWLPSRIAFARTVALVPRQQACAVDRADQPEERRFPFLDQDLLEFLLAIPANQLIRPGERRSLMRRSLQGFLPAEILHRKTKAVTIRKFMNAVQMNKKTLEALFAPDATRGSDFISTSGIRQSLDRARNGDAAQMVRLMKTVALELWLRDVSHRGLLRPVCADPSPRQAPV